MYEVVNRFIHWVVQTPASMFLQNQLWAIPTLQTIHILCVALVFVAAAMLDFKLLGFLGKEQSLIAMVQRYLPSAWVGLAVLAVTGSLLIIAEPARSIMARPFQLKMALLLAVVILTATFHRVIVTQASRWDTPEDTPPAARLTALTSLALWIAIIVAGRWIAYAESV